MRTYDPYLKDIIEAIDSIVRFVERTTLAEFQNDDKTASAVIRKFEIIGEAAKQVPDEIQQRYPDAPWKEMAGMRDRLIHFDFGVNLRLIWRTIHEDLPTAKREVQKALDSETI